LQENSLAEDYKVKPSSLLQSTRGTVILSAQSDMVGMKNAIETLEHYSNSINRFYAFPFLGNDHGNNFSRIVYLRSSVQLRDRYKNPELMFRRWNQSFHRLIMVRNIKEPSGNQETQRISASSSEKVQVGEESFWQSIIDQSLDGIIIIDANHQIVFANPSARHMYEKNRQEIIGQHCGFVPSLNSSIVFNPLSSSNTAKLVEARTSEIQRGDKKVILSTLRPVPDLKQDNNVGLEFFCRLDPDGRILGANSTFNTYLSRVGFNSAVRKIFDLFSIQDHLNFEIEIEALQTQNSRGFLQTTLAGENETALHIDWELKAVLNKTEQICEIEALGHEQIGLSQLNEKLDLSQSIIENAMDGILLTDHKGRVVSINKAFTMISGYRLKEIIGKSVDVFRSFNHTDEFFESIKRQVFSNGFWQGEINNKRKSEEYYPSWVTIHTLKDGNGQILNYIFYVRDITENKVIETKLEKRATLDALTDLPNRGQFIERLTQALSRAKRNNEKVVVIYLDLDRFKVINDNYGHEIGDLLLKQVSERLLSVSRHSDTIARMGGDEFAILLVGPSIAPVIFAQKVLGIFSNPFKVDDYEFYVTCSIGISIFPDDGEDGSTLMKNSDLAMYQAKELGRNYFQFFSPELNERAHRQMDMGADLRQAIQNEEFTLDYQPIVDANTGRILSIEALIRWENTRLGRVYPDTFIPLAESTGLIVPIGDWVLETACRETQILHNAGWNDLTVSVNISGFQLERNALITTVRNALASTELPPVNLVLEITESLLMKNVKDTRKILQELRSLGVKVSIDDFGTGYSSLNSLMVFPINTIKIDKSFIRELTSNPQNLTLVQGIIQIGHNLHLDVVAEGVETAEQASLLRSNECDELQGYHFSTPLSLDLLLDQMNATHGLLG
jgi:diguanylate cyclase (GGDEF)-like protein/PAS domain S-box-containing protein